MNKIRVWDLPLRLFHWVLVILVGFSFYSGLTGGLALMDYHMLSGYSILTLVLFRIAWGFFGPHYAKFANFVPRPRQTMDALRHLFDRNAPASVGHNPLGALSILAMLIALLVQATTGLFANDDIFIEGPLMHLVSEGTSNQLTEIHEINLWVIAALVSLHLIAILYYEAFKGQRLVLPMISGNKHVADDRTPTVHHRLFLALVLAALAAAGVYLLVTRA